MTNEEAITVLKVHREFFNEEIGDALDMAIKALEKQEKYRWHDLGKNPDDLPKTDETEILIACYISSERIAYYIANFAINLFDVDNYDFCGHKDENGFYFLDDEWGHCKHTDVIAWREIEPFEEGDSE